MANIQVDDMVTLSDNGVGEVVSVTGNYVDVKYVSDMLSSASDNDIAELNAHNGARGVFQNGQMVIATLPGKVVRIEDVHTIVRYDDGIGLEMFDPDNNGNNNGNNLNDDELRALGNMIARAPAPLRANIPEFVPQGIPPAPHGGRRRKGKNTYKGRKVKKPIKGGKKTRRPRKKSMKKTK